MMGSRGSQDPRWQRWIPRAIVIGQVVGVSGGIKSTTFSVPVPDSRLRVKTSLLFVRGSASVTDPVADLHLFEADTEDAGMNGGDIALTDLEGSFTTPTPIPQAVGLLGYSREFITAADYINGVLRMTPNGVPGFWVLQTRYQPQNSPFSKEEWDIVIAQCNPTGQRVQVG